MSAGRPLTDEQHLCNFSVGAALDHETKDLRFSGSDQGFLGVVLCCRGRNLSGQRERLGDGLIERLPRGDLRQPPRHPGS